MKTRMPVNFEYGVMRIRDLVIKKDAETETSSRRTRLAGRRRSPSYTVEVEGTLTKATGRFWTSIAGRYGISQNMFGFFSPDEVLCRVAEKHSDDKVRYCIEYPHKGPGYLLAVSNPNRPLVEHGPLVEVLSQFDAIRTSYATGMVSSTHKPRRDNPIFNIGGDQFKRRILFEAPIDGYGQPRIYTSLLRLLCTNGMVGYSPAFRSDIKLGDNVMHSIRRGIDSFDDAEGYEALGQRFESAQTSWASVHECVRLRNSLHNIRLKPTTNRQELFRDLERRTGDLSEIYGVANLDALGKKRQRVLPSQARVYDLLNFASEVATHHARPSGARLMQLAIGNLVSDEYDMEGTAEMATDFGDFLVSGRETKRERPVQMALS